MSDSVDQGRRQFLKTACVSGAIVLASGQALARTWSIGSMKELAFRNVHTDEKVRVTFWRGGRFDPAAMEKINYILRDFRTGDVYPMATNLVDLLHTLQTRLRSDGEIEIISGYRSARTNAMLAKASGGVANKSLHMEGLAADIRIPRVSLRRLQTEALFLRRGGVGFYPESGFVHVDVGRVRRWG